mmetsp:Transcript_53229/g.61112  ORF Transcript_53229/g.61112 Transcript_53229/m.61112 type:complete len:318 (+) Transcript_53229:669-1622(+)
MEFLGEGMVPAPRLRNAELTTEQLSQVYLDLIMMMRRLYHECKLIHADLSEYNLLYWKEKLWVIDVSQSIEHDHPYALDFLRRDIYNVNQYFHKNNVRTFAIKTVFDYITDINIKTSKESLEALIEMNKDFDADKAKEEENVFASIYIPRTLEEMDIKHIERDLQKEEELVYSKLTGINKGEKQKASGWVNVEDKEGEEGKVDEEDEEDESDDSEESNDESSSEEDNSNDDSGSDDGDESDSEEGEKTEGKEAKEGAEEGEEGEKKPNRKLSDKEANKERKKKLKEEKREKRQSKMKKKDKAKLIKKTQTTKQKKKT